MSPPAKSLKIVLDKRGYKNAIETAKKLKSKNKDFILTENEINMGLQIAIAEKAKRCFGNI